MARTQKLLYTNSHHCQWHRKRTLFWGEEVPSGPENVAEGAVWYCLLHRRGGWGIEGVLSV